MENRITVNCDIGERGPEHPVDLTLMSCIDIANIACGGHAGDRCTAARFRNLADEHGVTITAHLSYPDPENFGRVSMVLSDADLVHALDRQLQVLPDANLVKFHGALYNDSCGDSALAELLAFWLHDRGISGVLTLPDSALAHACRPRSIQVLDEAFAERRYCYDPIADRLLLASRHMEGATIEDLDEAVLQAERMIRHGTVYAFPFPEYGGSGQCPALGDARLVRARFATICVHSDSPIALPLARKLREVLRS